MARPKSKTELLIRSQENYKILIDLLESLSINEQDQEFPLGTLNRNISDVLAHLHHWHLMLMEWYKVGMSGQKPDMPAKGYTWKSTPELNKWIQQKYHDRKLTETRKLLNTSYLEIQKIIENHSDDELFEKKRFKWTGTTSLGAYLVSATSSHYDWAFKLIRKSLQTPFPL